tara:strand:- start:608 stop:1111 length:504 start_codon:yes stop_codon:yes gene_type:complete
MYSEFKQMDIDDVAYNYVRDELLNYHNIKQHYANIEDPQDYKQYLFNERESKIAYFHIKFQRIVSKCEHDYNYIMYRNITPVVLEYSEEYNIHNEVASWIYAGNDARMLSMFALSIADEIIDTYQDFINDILNDTTARKIAISKIKRNKIVNCGILMKMSMRDCGMF